ncbi:hypothetical protein JCM10296v2_001333 [Rhodotorula toruloides]
MAATHRYKPYKPLDQPPTPARWKKRPRLALQSTSAANSLAAPGRAAEDVKGKAEAAEGVVPTAKSARAWKEAGTSRTSRRTKRAKRVEAGHVDVPLLGKNGARPVMVEVELGEGSENGSATNKRKSVNTRRTSTFVFLPHATSNSFSVLLVKSAAPAVVHLFTTFISTRFDALVHPFRIHPPRMLDLLETLVLHRDRSLEETASTDETVLATNMTFAFPPKVAREGLSTITLTLPPAILPSLTSDPSSSFVSRLTAHMIQMTSIPLSSLFLVRLGAGRGTFVHSGQGAGEGGAKVKFFRGAEEGGEIRRVLEELVRAAEDTSRAR